LFPGELQATQTNGWSISGGAEGAWKNQNTGITAGYSRGVSDGGGVLGTVLLQTVHASFRREIIKGWATALYATHGTNQSLTVPLATSASSINLTSAGISLDHNVTKTLGLRMGFSHDLQQQFGLPAPNPTQNATRNRVFLTLSYQWAKPLGM
jgi:hypothetical protein